MSSTVEKMGAILSDREAPLKKRFRALFELKNLSTPECIDFIYETICKESSVLLKHECCYCMGQMDQKNSIKYLIKILDDFNENCIVRHEAGEALANLALLADEPVKEKIFETLFHHCDDTEPIVSQTCDLGVNKIRWFDKADEIEKSKSHSEIFCTKDPAPPFEEFREYEEFEKLLISPEISLFEKYRALFSLRNVGCDRSVNVLGKTLVHYKNDRNMALLSHEIGYIFGQMCSLESIPYLKEIVFNLNTHDIARHEAIEALGSIATEECMKILAQFINDKSRVVAESVQVALDMCDYNNSAEMDLISS